MVAPRNPKWTYLRQWLFWPFTWILSRFVTQDSNLIVLTSFHGDGYRGNTRRLIEWYYFERGDTSESSKRLVWLSRNKRVVAELKSRYGSTAAEYAHSLRGALLLVKSKVALLTHGTSDYPFMYIPSRTHVIQTYHGLPTKRGEFMSLDGEDAPGPVATYFLNRRFQPIDTFLSTSDFVTDIFSRRFGLDASRFLKIGFPVYDELISRKSDQEWIRSLYLGADSNTRMVLYAPTFRYRSATQLFPFGDIDTGDLARFLEHENLVLVIRTHPNDTILPPVWIAGVSRIVVATDKIVEHVNDLIVNASIIITDYSSIYLEGLLRDIPTVFVPYDLNEYERGFPFGYDSVTPGPHVGTYREWKSAVLEGLHGAVAWKMRRDEVRKLFFEKSDANSTLRLWEFIDRL
jgi:CDP-glycerol glycerophosphotransferase (TagB/SpsB family)